VFHGKDKEVNETRSLDQTGPSGAEGAFKGEDASS